MPKYDADWYENKKDPDKKDVKFAGNYQGPLYAPHPDLTKKQQEDRLKAYEDYNKTQESYPPSGHRGSPLSE